jgi:parvulin-like peptidyl-prolyl isomerase
MTEEFARAAFGLKPGEISPPVISAFGVHLIQVTETRPGDKTWSDVRKEIEPLAAKELFDQLVRQDRAKVKVEYTGEAPYLDPKDGKLVEGRAGETGR